MTRDGRTPYVCGAPSSLIGVYEAMLREQQRGQEIAELELKYPDMDYEELYDRYLEDKYPGGDGEDADEDIFTWPTDGLFDFTKKIAILGRLLKSPRMMAAWETLLSTPSIPPASTARREPDSALAIWSLIDYWLDHSLLDKRTPKKKSKELRKLAERTRALVHAISADATARPMMVGSIQYFARARQIQFCREQRIDPRGISDFLMPGNHLGDDGRPTGTDAFCNNPIVRKWTGSIPRQPRQWRHFPAKARFGFWTKELADIQLDEVLEQLAARFELAADEPPEIKHPGGSHSGLKPKLIAELRGFIESRYGEPLNGARAAILSAVFNEEIETKNLAAYDEADDSAR